MRAMRLVGRDARHLQLRRVLVLTILAVLIVGAPAEAATAKVVHSGPRSSAGVALTFDDGWDVGACANIARTLRREHVVGTFFINGAHVRKAPERWRRIIGDMPFANHTGGHRNLAREPGWQIRKQIRSSERIHEQVLGRPMLKILRPPYGAYDRQVLRIAHEMGYRHVVTWSVTAADTSRAATVRSVIRRTTGAPPGAIILMHCNNDLSARALPTVIRHYKSRGLELLGLDEMLGLAEPRPVDHMRLMEPMFERYARSR